LFMLTGCKRSIFRLARRWKNPKSFAFNRMYIRAVSTVSAEQELAVLLNSPPDKIRNFSIIAHIDHGKSTLADCLLNLTGQISDEQRQDAQVLDNLEVERERGITVKAQTASIFYNLDTTAVDSNPSLGLAGKESTYVLNLIDTPGHVDFAYEVRKSLDACEGALLLIDSSQGVQAQTLANFNIAKSIGLEIIPVLTKTDLPASQPDVVREQVKNLFGFEPEDCLTCSAKSGAGVMELFPHIISRFPAPPGQPQSEFRALLFDSWHDFHRGVVCLIRVVDGEVQVGDKISMYHKTGTYEVFEIGYLKPERVPTRVLRTGQVGYVICNIKSARDVRLGDTVFKAASSKENLKLKQASVAAQTKIKSMTPLPGFQPAKSMVFAGLFPSQSDAYDELREAMDKLTLNDPSVEVEKESSLALGLGFRCGFLGALHMEVFCQRLEQEFQANVILTSPTVPYKMLLSDGTETQISSPSDFPDDALSSGTKFQEPWINASIITPEAHTAPLMRMLDEHRGVLETFDYFSSETVHLTYQMPLAEVITNLYTRIKSASSGYASLDITPSESKDVELTKVVIKVNNEAVDPFSILCHKDKAVFLAKRVCEKLHQNIPRQQFLITIQACIGSKIIASERIRPYRKDVLIKSGKTVGGGDVSRKKKLLEKQKEGKKRMKYVGNVQLDEKVFLAVVKQD